MAAKSKFIFTAMFLLIFSPSLTPATPVLSSPSRVIPSACNVSNPSQPKGCVVKDFGALLRKQIETYVAFTNEKDSRFESEYKSCIARENKLLWEQYFGSFESNQSRFEFPQDKSISAAEYLTAMANAQIDWINKVEGYFASINHDQVKSCLEFMVYSLNSDYGPIPEKNYKREWTADYHEIFAKYLIASEENMKVNPANRKNLYNQFLSEVFAVYNTAGKQRIDKHLKLLSPIRAIAESAKLVANNEKAKIITDGAKAAAQAKSLAEAQAKREAELQARADKEAQSKVLADAQARAKVLANGGCMNKVTGGAIANGQRSFGNTCVNGRLIADKPAVSTSKSGSCQDPTSGMLVKNGASINYVDGTRTCLNGKWSNPMKSGGSSGGKTLVSKTCTKSTTGLTSDWNGAQYSWTIWNNWSDGSKTVASMGSGYLSSVPYGC